MTNFLLKFQDISTFFLLHSWLSVSPWEKITRRQVAKSRWVVLVSTQRDYSVWEEQSDCFSRSVTSFAVLLKPYIFNVHLVQMRPKKITVHITVTNPIDCNSISFLVFEKVRTDNTSTPNSTPNRNSLRMHFFFSDHSRVLRSPYCTILFVYEPV